MKSMEVSEGFFGWIVCFFGGVLRRVARFLGLLKDFSIVQDKPTRVSGFQYVSFDFRGLQHLNIYEDFRGFSGGFQGSSTIFRESPGA